jgi:hypothetical protein
MEDIKKYINDTYIFDIRKEKFFEIYFEPKELYLLLDPKFSKISKSFNYKNFLYIIDDIENIKWSIRISEDIWIEDHIKSLLFTDIKYEYRGILETNCSIVLKYKTILFLDKFQTRIFKINSLII